MKHFSKHWDVRRKGSKIRMTRNDVSVEFEPVTVTGHGSLLKRATSKKNLDQLFFGQIYVSNQGCIPITVALGVLSSGSIPSLGIRATKVMRRRLLSCLQKINNDALTEVLQKTRTQMV